MESGGRGVGVGEEGEEFVSFSTEGSSERF